MGGVNDFERLFKFLAIRVLLYPIPLPRRNVHIDRHCEAPCDHFVVKSKLNGEGAHQYL